MTRRDVRRRYAILGVLHEHGPQYVTDLTRTLHVASGTLYPELAELEGGGWIAGELPRVPDAAGGYVPPQRDRRRR